MRVAWLISAVLLWPTCLFAQDRPVLSGEHGSFTRLSIPVPPEAQWQLDEREDAYVLRVEDAFEYDFTSVFRRIGRDRISALIQEGSDLRIDLSCDCSASTFLFRDRFVVVDISDTPRVERRAEDDNAALMAIAAPDRELSLPLVSGIEGPTVVKTLRAPTPASPAPEAGEVDLGAVQRQLSDALRDAAEADLLVNRDLADLVALPVPTRDGAADIATSAGPSQTLPGLQFRSGSTIQASPSGGSQSSNCWPTEYTDVASWVTGDTSFADVIGDRRATLTDAAGAADPSALLSLAKAYLYFGFGAEAALTLALDRSDSRARQALRAMAEITDETGPGDALITQSGCSGPIALWVYLAAKDEMPLPSGAVLAFKNLPIGLRLALGARLARKLSKDGHTEQRDQVLQALADDNLPANEIRIIETEISLMSDDAPFTSARLDTWLASESVLPEGILIALTDRTLEAGIAPPPMLVSQLEDRMFVARGTPVASALRAALIRVEIATGDFLRAFERAQPTTEPVPDEMTALRSEVVTAAARDADTATVVQIAFHPEARTTDAKAQNALARRLLDLGFPDVARGLLDGPAEGGTMGERRYLRAEAEVAMGDKERAAQTLAGITTPRADAILSGNDWAVLRSDEDARTALAWRQADWTTLVEMPDPTLKDLATLATRAAPRPSPTALLTSGRLIADEAAAARATLELGLNRFTAPTE